MATLLLKAFRATMKPASSMPPSEKAGRGATLPAKTANQLITKAKIRPNMQPPRRRYRQRYRFAPAIAETHAEARSA